MSNPHGFMYYPDTAFGYPVPLPPVEMASPAYPPQPPSPLKEEFEDTIPIDPVGNSQNIPPAQEQRELFSHPMFSFPPPYMFLPPPSFTPVHSPFWPNFNPVPPTTNVSSESTSSSRKNIGNKNNSRRFPDYIKTALIARYQHNKFISGKDREVFATQLGLSTEQVKIWFQNQRYKDKKSAVSPKENLSSKNYVPYSAQ